MVLPHDIGKEETRYQPQKGVLVILLIEHSSIIMEIELFALVKRKWDHRKTANFQRMCPEKTGSYSWQTTFIESVVHEIGVFRRKTRMANSLGKAVEDAFPNPTFSLGE